MNGNQNNNGAPVAGAAYVFERSGTTWSQAAYIKASNTDLGDHFGWSVAVDGDTLVVGAYGDDSSDVGVDGTWSDNSASDAGAAYVFERNGTTWSQAAYLKASNTDAGDLFGSFVGIADDTVVVGALWESSNATGVDGNQNNNSASQAGAAYVFVRGATSWSQEAYLKASNTDAIDWFGRAVAVSGNTVVIGAHREDSNATGVDGDQSDNSALDAGAAYVFARSGTSWSQVAYLKPSNTDADDQFAWSVAVFGDTVVVGSDWEDSSATGVDGDQADNSALKAGAAYVFTRTGTSWTQASYLKASNTGAIDGFGVSVAVSEGTIVVGAPGEDSIATGTNGDPGDNTAPSAGAAYVFDSGLGTVYCIATANSTGAPAAITASGRASIAANDLSLRTEPVPNQPGIFFYGPDQASVPFGNGTLCIAGQVGRLDVVNAAGNVMTFLVDNTNPPSLPTQISVGSTWHFQAWYRDPMAGGAFFNLSDAITLVFGP